MGYPGGPLRKDVSGSISATVLLLLFSCLGEHWEKTPLHVTEEHCRISGLEGTSEVI